MSELPDWVKAIPGFDPTGLWVPIVCIGAASPWHPLELIGIYFPDSRSGAWRCEGRPACDEHGNRVGYYLKREIMANVRWFREEAGERVEEWVEEDGTRRKVHLPSDIAGGQVRTGMASERRGTPFIGCSHPDCEFNPRVTLEQFDQWLGLGHAGTLQFLSTSLLT